MTTTVATVTPEIAAAMDVRVLDVIENVLMDYRFNNKLIDDLVLSIQEYLKSTNSSTQAALALIAEQAKLRGVFKIVQQVKNSKDFLDLVKLNTPDENIATMSAAPFVNGEIIAAGTTATEVIKSKPDATVDEPESSKASKAPKTPKLPMPTIASIEALEAMSRRELVQAAQALNHHALHTGITGKSASTLIKAALAHHILNSAYVAPASPAKAPKATKAKTQEIISLPEGLSWEECKGMKYRQLQQVCKALRSQGLFQGNIGGKGATGEALLKGCADYFRSQGVDIAEVTVSPSKTPIKELHLSNLARARKDAKLAKLAKLAVAA